MIEAFIVSPSQSRQTLNHCSFHSSIMLSFDAIYLRYRRRHSIHHELASLILDFFYWRWKSILANLIALKTPEIVCKLLLFELRLMFNNIKLFQTNASDSIWRWNQQMHINIEEYSRVSFYDDSLLRPLSSRTEHSRLVVHHCRNSSVLALLKCASSSFPVCMCFFFFYFSAVLLSWLWFFHPWRPSDR